MVDLSPAHMLSTPAHVSIWVSLAVRDCAQCLPVFPILGCIIDEYIVKVAALPKGRFCRPALDLHEKHSHVTNDFGAATLMVACTSDRFDRKFQ
jgi:hypothetical protein